MLKVRITLVLSVIMLLALWLVGSASSQKPELIARWPLDETSGDVVHDVIGGNDGEFKAGKLEWAPGNFGNGLQFDGVGYVEITKNPDLELTDSVTLIAWVKFGSVAGRQDIVSYADSYAIMMEATMRGFIFQGGWPMANGATTIKPEEWYFAAMTYDSTDINVYVNGELDGSIAAPGVITYQNAPFWFGGAPADPGQQWFLKGILDEVEIWNGAMTEDEIMATYQSPPPSLLVTSRGKLAVTWGGLKLR